MSPWALLVVVTACTHFDPEGSYQGAAVRTSVVTMQDADNDAQGAAPTTATTARSTLPNLVITVRRVDDEHLEIDLPDGCTVRAEIADDHTARVDRVTPRSCHHIDGFDDGALSAGRVTFDDRGVQLTFHTGTGRGLPFHAGFETINADVTFDGERL